MPRAAIAQVAVSKSLRLIQIASGYVTDAEGNDYYFAKNPKLDLLQELLEELDGQKVIVWAHFKANHKMIISLLDKMKIKYVQLDGNATLKEKAERQELFETKPEYQVCLANQGAAGTGLNLKAAGYSIYFSKDYSYGKDEQSAGRNFRGGSIDLHKKVTRFDLITEGTIEERVMEVIKGKQEISNIILDWSKL
jgi:DNA helicase INO80